MRPLTEDFDLAVVILVLFCDGNGEYTCALVVGAEAPTIIMVISVI